jgi:predicted acyltransferase
MRLRDAIYHRVFAPLASPINASLMYALAYTFLMFVVAVVLYRRQWFLKV